MRLSKMLVALIVAICLHICLYCPFYIQTGTINFGNSVVEQQHAGSNGEDTPGAVEVCFAVQECDATMLH